jgi:hypothetical protein
MGHVSGGSADAVGGRCTPTGASSPSVPAASSSQRPGTARPLAGCRLAAPPQATTPLDRFRPAARDRVPTMPSADFCGAVREDSSTLSPCQDTPQISRGQRSYRRCIDAGFIKHSQLWMEDFAVPCQLVPGLPRLRSGCCTSLRAFVPRFLQTPPYGGALTLSLSFGSTNLDGGLAPPCVETCPAHTGQLNRVRLLAHRFLCAG